MHKSHFAYITKYSVYMTKSFNYQLQMHIVSILHNSTSQTLTVQLLTYSNPVLSIIVRLPSKSFESGTKSPCAVNQSKSKSVLSLESPPKSYPHVGEMIHIFVGKMKHVGRMRVGKLRSRQSENKSTVHPSRLFASVKLPQQTAFKKWLRQALHCPS